MPEPAVLGLLPFSDDVQANEARHIFRDAAEKRTPGNDQSNESVITNHRELLLHALRMTYKNATKPGNFTPQDLEVLKFVKEKNVSHMKTAANSENTLILPKFAEEEKEITLSQYMDQISEVRKLWETFNETANITRNKINAIFREDLQLLDHLITFELRRQDLEMKTLELKVTKNAVGQFSLSLERQKAECELLQHEPWCRALLRWQDASNFRVQTFKTNQSIQRLCHCSLVTKTIPPERME